MAIIIWDPVIQYLTWHYGDQVYYRRGNTCCARAYKKPYNPDTALQRISRGMLSAAVRSWQELPAGEERGVCKEAC